VRGVAAGIPAPSTAQLFRLLTISRDSRPTNTHVQREMDISNQQRRQTMAIWLRWRWVTTPAGVISHSLRLLWRRCQNGERRGPATYTHGLELSASK